LFAIFDGHGGREIVDYLIEKLPAVSTKVYANDFSLDV